MDNFTFFFCNFAAHLAVHCRVILLRARLHALNRGSSACTWLCSSPNVAEPFSSLILLYFHSLLIFFYFLFYSSCKSLLLFLRQAMRL